MGAGAAAALLAVTLLAPDETVPGARVGALGARGRAESPAPRGIDAYRGQGAWIDAFDYAPAYQSSGRSPTLAPSVVDDMAAHGVHTLFIQAARDDARSPQGIVDPALVAQFLVRAHRHGMRVVAWYLSKFGDVAADLRRLAQLADFDVLGHRFDGLAVDIEFAEDVPDPVARGARLVELSQALRREVGTDALGAIVFPPVQTEVVNPTLWPDFPWRELGSLYDAWLPMSYWTFRGADSGYRDGYTYNEESTRRLRANLGDPDAPVHAIGGIADLVEGDDLARFAQSLVDTDAIGGSLYDWNTSSAATRAAMTELFTGPLATVAPR